MQHKVLDALITILVVAVLSLGVYAVAFAASGDTFMGQASFCTQKENAVALAKLESEKGFKAAGEQYMKDDTCGAAAGLFVMGPHVFTVKTERGTVNVDEAVLFLQGGQSATVYILSLVP